MEEFKVTREGILAAAATCSTVENALKKMFPEAFKGNKYIKLTEDETRSMSLYNNNGILIAIAYGITPSEDLKLKCFLLSGNVDWEIKVDSGNNRFLIPTRK